MRAIDAIRCSALACFDQDVGAGLEEVCRSLEAGALDLEVALYLSEILRVRVAVLRLAQIETDSVVEIVCYGGEHYWNVPCVPC